MGCGNSKAEKDEALRLCRDRRRFVKLAIEARYGLAARHVSYVESLRGIGVALRRFAEAEALIESSLSVSDKTLSPYPSPSPSHPNEAVESPATPKGAGNPVVPNFVRSGDSGGGNQVLVAPVVSRLSYMKSGGDGGTNAISVTRVVPSFSFVNSSKSGAGNSVSENPVPVSPIVSSLSYMRSSDNGVGGLNAVTVRFSPASDSFAEEFQPPPPPPFACRNGSWDYFDPVDENGSDHSFRFEGFKGGFEDGEDECDERINDEAFVQLSKKDAPVTTTDQSGSKEKDLSGGEREDPSEFITHRAKDFLSSIKEIEHRFFRASESGKEVARMLEANKISVGYSEAKANSSSSPVLQALQLVCCHGPGSLVSKEPTQHGTKVITWKRTTSSRSSSSRNPLGGASKDDGNDSGSDFVEEFCMIAGSHSSTLDRLYAWERKLYDEVKASEAIRKEYDQKCKQLRYMCAKDYSSQVIDKTRAAVKDLHSRICVAIHSVDQISKRIERMRDEELHPQLVELTQGFIRMWKSMLECHHAQYITISLAYHSKNTSESTPRGEAHRQITEELLQEGERFGLSFAEWVNGLSSYVAALNRWLLNSVILPRERSKRRPFSPRRYLGPPIFALCRDWSAEIGSLPSDELTDAMQAFLSELRRMTIERRDEPRENREEENANRNEFSSNLSSIQATLTKVLDRLTKFSEASLKMYEDLKQKNEAVRAAYTRSRC